MKSRYAPRDRSIATRSFALSLTAMGLVLGCATAPDGEFDANEALAESAEELSVMCPTTWPREPKALDSQLSICSSRTASASSRALAWIGGDVYVNACPPDYTERSTTAEGTLKRCIWSGGDATPVTKVAAGAHTSFALNAKGDILAWGSRDDFAIPTFPPQPTPAASAFVPGKLGGARPTLSGGPDARFPTTIALRGAKDIAAAQNMACAIVQNGDVYCWGVIATKSLGTASPVAWTSPTKVTGIANAAGISVGTSHACAWNAAGTAYCWGNGDLGQLGDGEETEDDVGFERPLCNAQGLPAGCLGPRSHADARAVTGLGAVSKILASGDSTCALTQPTAQDPNKYVYCFGSNQFGAFGDGSEGLSTGTPRKVSFDDVLNNVPWRPANVFGGADTYCADVESPNPQGSPFKRRLCWGKNTHGQLGVRDPDVRDTVIATPVPQTALTWSSNLLFMGPDNMCQSLPLDLPATHCWGNNAHGQLLVAPSGTGNPVNQPITEARTSTSMAIGVGHVCAVVKGAVRCWGNNDASQVVDNQGMARDVWLRTVDVNLGEKWPGGEVPVCFDDVSPRPSGMTATQLAERKRDIKARALAAWPSVAMTNFNGWGSCPTTSEGGPQLDRNKINGTVVIRFIDSEQSNSCSGYNPKTSCELTIGTRDPRYTTTLVTEELARVLGLYRAGPASPLGPQGGADVAMDPNLIVAAQRMFGRRIEGVVLMRQVQPLDSTSTESYAGVTNDVSLQFAGGPSRRLVPEGWALAVPAPGTVPLKRYYNGPMNRYMVTTSVPPANSGFTSPVLEAYVFPESVRDGAELVTTPLRRYKHVSSGRYVTTTATLGEAAGYELVGLEGHVFVKMPYRVGGRWQRQVKEGQVVVSNDNVFAAVNRSVAREVEAAGYKFKGLDGAILSFQLPGTQRLFNYSHAGVIAGRASPDWALAGTINISTNLLRSAYQEQPTPEGWNFTSQASGTVGLGAFNKLDPRDWISTLLPTQRTALANATYDFRIDDGYGFAPTREEAPKFFVAP